MKPRSSPVDPDRPPGPPGPKINLNIKIIKSKLIQIGPWEGGGGGREIILYYILYYIILYYTNIIIYDIILLDYIADFAEPIWGGGGRGEEQ